MNNFIEKELYLGYKHDLIKAIYSNINRKEKKAYYAINTDCMLKYWTDKEYQQIINRHDCLAYVDGMGVIFAQKILKLPYAKERIATTDLFPSMMEFLEKKGCRIRIFLLGGEGNTAELVRENFKLEYPNVDIVGTHHGYFNKEKDSITIINLINSLKVDVLFVGFGNPMQEKWVNQYYDLLQTNSIITCGGLFDYYSNNVKRAPIFMQRIGLEWFYRLLQEPKRLYKRYIFGNIKYLFKIFQLKINRN